MIGRPTLRVLKGTVCVLLLVGSLGAGCHKDTGVTPPVSYDASTYVQGTVLDLGNHAVAGASVQVNAIRPGTGSLAMKADSCEGFPVATKTLTTDSSGRFGVKSSYGRTEATGCIIVSVKPLNSSVATAVGISPVHFAEPVDTLHVTITIR